MTAATLEQRLILVVERLPRALRIGIVSRVYAIRRLVAREPPCRVNLDRQPLQRRSAHSAGAHLGLTSLEREPGRPIRERAKPKIASEVRD